jgi:hypothetical protein
MPKVNFKKLGRKAKNTMKRVGTIIRKGAGIVRGIIGNIDKISGGQLSRAISSDPRGAALMSGVNQLADRDARMMDREKNKNI